VATSKAPAARLHVADTGSTVNASKAPAARTAYARCAPRHSLRSFLRCLRRLRRPRGCPSESHPAQHRTSYLPSLAAHDSRLRRSRSPRPSCALLAPLSGRSQAHAGVWFI